jgi:hypothetical protein
MKQYHNEQIKYACFKRKKPLFEKSGAKTFDSAGSWAMSPTTPMTQIHKVFLLLFVHKK